MSKEVLDLADFYDVPLAGHGLRAYRQGVAYGRHGLAFDHGLCLLWLEGTRKDRQEQNAYWLGVYAAREGLAK